MAPDGRRAQPEGLNRPPAAPDGRRAQPEGLNRPPADSIVALRSERHMRFFGVIFARFFAKHMRALRVQRSAPLPPLPAGAPVIVFANHPGWWDGVVFMLAARGLFPGRPAFVPMDAAALARYPFMRRLGVFGIEQRSPRGAVAFLRDATAVLAAPSHMLWINAPGRFCDVRERPVPIAPGLPRLPELAPGAVFLPMAIEYAFWSERAPEALLGFGAPIPAASLLEQDREARTETLRAALTATMDALALDAMARDEARFDALAQGREGMGGIYGLWQRIRATLRGAPFDPRHGVTPPKDP